jgi:hypothetical protein
MSFTKANMNNYFSFGLFILFLLFCANILASDSSSYSSDDEIDNMKYYKLDEDESYCSLDDLNEKLPNENEKIANNVVIALDNACFCHDIPTIAAIYFIKKKQQYNEIAASIPLGILAAAAIAGTPFVFITVIPGVICIGACAISSRMAQVDRQIKQKAKRYLQENISSELFMKITKFKTRHSLEKFIALLKENGLDVTSLRKKL